MGLTSSSKLALAPAYGAPLSALAKLCAGPGVHERRADGIPDEVMDEAGLAETYLGLGGVYVDVDFLRGHLHKQQHDGKAGGRNDVAVSLRQRVQDKAVSHEAVVDEDVDGVAIEALQLRL